jgi:multicomponent Na+:H+ antiporter subunit D
MQLIPLFVAIPLGIAFLLPILGKFWKRSSDILANLVNLTLLALSLISLHITHYTLHNVLVYKVGGWQPVNGIPIGIYMVLDGFSILMLIIINLVGFLATLYSVEYMEKFTDKARYYTLFLLMMAGMNGVVLSGDMFNLFVFLEVAAISSYALVAFGTEAEELEAAFKYQVMGTVASGFILLAIAILYSHVGTLNMADTARILAVSTPNNLILFVGSLFLMGFGLKAAIMPFHAWLPDAHPSAPAPISAMLSGVLIKAIGVYALCRIFFNVIGLAGRESILYLLMILGVISMLVGALLAIGQKDFKRLLAYSSISQIGYIIFSFGLGTPLGLLGGLFHLLNHATFKSLLFLNSGAVVYSTGNRDLEKMGGLSERMPVTGATSLIGSMSISGIPPLSGFWSKLIIIIAAIEAGRFGFALIAVLVSIITLAYYLKVQRMAFFGKLSGSQKEIKEAPPFMCTSMIILSILCIIMGLLLLPQVRLIIFNPAVQVLRNGLEYSKSILGG